MNFLRGELVTRKSYGNDVLFKIASLKDDVVLLHGVDVRLVADAPYDDIVRVNKQDLKRRQQTSTEQEEFSYRLFKQDYQMLKEKRTYETTNGYEHKVPFFRLPIRVLHLDGDASYLKKCIQLYERLGIQVHGIHLNEKEMPHEITSLLQQLQPELLVITGHDSYSKQKGQKKDLQAYRNSTHFTETVRAARKEIPHLDQLVIFAGACQSHFESLIRAGANFASSPARINIHALDPVYIAAKIAYTPFMEKVNVFDVVRNTFTGEKGMGGIETRGLHRIGMPYLKDDEQRRSMR